MNFDFLPDNYSVRVEALYNFNSSHVITREVKVNLLKDGTTVRSANASLSNHFPNVWPSIVKDHVKIMFDAYNADEAAAKSMKAILGNFDNKGRVNAR